MPPALLTAAPDLSDDYWRVSGNHTTVLQINGGRLFLEHWFRVQRARMAVEQCLGAVAVAASDNPND